MQPPFQRPNRVLLAVEMPDGSATVYELHGGVSLMPISASYAWHNDLPEIEMLINAQFVTVHTRPASDYFEERPEIAPPQRALNP